MNNDKEIWKPSVWFGDMILVSSSGSIKKKDNNGVWRDVRFKPKKNGYYLVCCCIKGVKYYKTVHRIVAETFIPNPYNKKEVDHINTIRTDNRVENLRWVTRQENQSNDITRKNRSIAIKNNPIRMKMSIYNINKWNSKKDSKDWCKKLHEMNKIPVIGTDIYTGKIYMYSCAKEAEKDGFRQSAISQCLRMNYVNKIGKNIYKNIKWERAN